jgi:carbonic anhydrase/acetyltransferase-like protein (isoleucine patch superfamily)
MDSFIYVLNLRMLLFLKKSSNAMALRSFEGFMPTIGNHVLVDDSALVIGQVSLGDDVSIWPMCVLRGDVQTIRIGNRTNIQDGCICHVSHASKMHPEGFALTIGNNVTVGHKAILHGCIISDYVLIGMGAIVMDGAVIPSQVMLAAGCLVPPNKTLESGFLYVGSPAKKSRVLTQQEKDYFLYSADHYVQLKNKHLGFYS